jgi:transposase, IS5 family
MLLFNRACFLGVFEAHTFIAVDFFRNRLDQMIDLSQPLAVLATRMPWQEIEDSDLFGVTEGITFAGVSKAGRPRLPTRLMVALLYLKYAFNESDEDHIQRWGETPTWQYFSGNEYVGHRWLCDPIQLVKFRKLLDEEGAEKLVASTIEVAVTLKLIASKELSRIIVDTTVQEKAIAHPTDSKLLETFRVKLVEAAKAQRIELKQTYAKEGQLLGFKAGRYAHVHQFKRMRKAIKRQGTIVGQLHREIARKMTTLSQAAQEALGVSMIKAKRLIALSLSKKAQDKHPKLYSWHAPELEYISKGKSRNPYEFNVKVGIDSTLQGTLILGARAFPAICMTGAHAH